MQRRATAGVAGAAGLLVLGLLAGCGVGPEDGATRLPDAEVPFDLLVRSETTVPAPDPAAEVAALYFVDGDRLEPVFREVAEDASARRNRHPLEKRERERCQALWRQSQALQPSCA